MYTNLIKANLIILTHTKVSKVEISFRRKVIKSQNFQTIRIIVKNIYRRVEYININMNSPMKCTKVVAVERK